MRQYALTDEKRPYHDAPLHPTTLTSISLATRRERWMGDINDSRVGGGNGGGIVETTNRVVSPTHMMVHSARHKHF